MATTPQAPPNAIHRPGAARLPVTSMSQVETSGESEVSTEAIGEMIMDGLQALDPVAYIRFASVYKDFREAKDFEDFAGSVGETGRE